MIVKTTCTCASKIKELLDDVYSTAWLASHLGSVWKFHHQWTTSTCSATA